MQWFIVEASNKPGEFARHAEAIGSRGVNLAGLVCLGIGDRGGYAFFSKDEAGLRTALNDAGLAYREVEAVKAKIEDKPGAAASAAKRLADAGVNIEILVPMAMSGGEVKIAFGVDKPDQARQALGDLVVERATTETPT